MEVVGFSELSVERGGAKVLSEGRGGTGGLSVERRGVGRVSVALEWPGVTMGREALWWSADTSNRPSAYSFM